MNSFAANWPHYGLVKPLLIETHQHNNEKEAGYALCSMIEDKRTAFVQIWKKKKHYELYDDVSPNL